VNNESEWIWKETVVAYFSPLQIQLDLVSVVLGCYPAYVVVFYRRFGTAYQFLLQDLSSQRRNLA
jgi:hypothetical protein